MESFQEATAHLYNRFIEDWEKTGRPIVGHTCSYVPAEIFHAAEILPVRLRGIETEGMEIGDAYFGPYICSFPKCLLQLAGKGKYPFLNGAIITPGCDSMRRLDECWRKAGEDYPGVVPDYFYYFDVPHKTRPHGMRWFAEEIRNLMASVERHFAVTVSQEALQRSIALYNRGRKMLGELEEIRSRPEVLLSGTDAFAVAIAGTVMPREIYTESLEQLLAELKTRAPLTDKTIRLMVIGSISDDIELIRLIEQNPGVAVVAENLCFGVRYEGHLIAEDADPVSALAEGYLGESTCPRMFGKYKERLAAIREKIQSAAVDGVIMQNIRFCDLHGSEHGLLERDLEAEGIPCLKIEREYGPLTDTGRINMRVQAFLERLA